MDVHTTLDAGLAVLAERDQMRRALVASLSSEGPSSCAEIGADPTLVRAWADYIGVDTCASGRLDVGLIRAFDAAHRGGGI